MKKRTFLTIALAGLAQTASAQAPGDILFTTDHLDGSSDTVELLRVASGTADLLVSWAPGDQTVQRQIGQIARGPNGEYYTGNSPLPVTDPSTASIRRIDNIFNPVTRTTSTFRASDPVQSVEGMAYDATTNNLLFANNPGSAFNLPMREEGILGIDLNNPANVSVVVDEPLFGDPRPRFNSFNIVRQDRIRNGNFYIGAVNGGVDSDPTIPASADNEASLIGRLVMNNPADPTDVTFTTLIDLSQSLTGLDRTLSRIRGIASADNGNIYVAEERTRSIYEVAIDGNGDATGISKIIDLDTELDSANTGEMAQPFGLIYNEFTGKLNYIEKGFGLTGRIVEVNLDGTGRTVLLDNVPATSLIAVPTPSTLALIGLGSLAATRRRRR